MLLEVRDLAVHYGAVRAVNGIDLSVDEGAIVTLIGANGAGKTTTLQAISNIVPKAGGTVMFRGEDITATPAHELVGLGIAHAPEGRGIFPGMSVQENLEMGCYSMKGGTADSFDRVFALFPILKDRRKQSGGTLSGGEQQMLSIGRALMASPSLLLLDEPSMGLAPLKVKQIFEVIRNIREQGTSILLVEQNAVQALQLADTAYVLERGQIVKSAPAAELLSDPAVRAAYLGA